MPKCEKCTTQPEMVVVRKEKIFGMGGTHAGQRYQMTSNLRRGGHPVVALAGSLLFGAASVANYFLENVEYKCRICGSTKSQIEGK